MLRAKRNITTEYRILMSEIYTELRNVTNFRLKFKLKPKLQHEVKFGLNFGLRPNFGLNL